MGRGFRRGGFSRRRPERIGEVDFKDTTFLSRFVTERGKIAPRRITGISAKDQRRIARAIRRARQLGILPFVAND